MQIACHLDSTFKQIYRFAVRRCLVSLSRLFEMSLIVNRKLYTAIDNLLCTKKAGTQWTMVSYFNKLKLKYKRKKKILGTVWDWVI